MLNYLSHNEKNNVINFFTDFAKKHNKKIFLDNENIRIEFKYNSNIGFDFTDNKIRLFVCVITFLIRTERLQIDPSCL